MGVPRYLKEYKFISKARSTVNIKERVTVNIKERVTVNIKERVTVNIKERVTEIGILVRKKV